MTDDHLYFGSVDVHLEGGCRRRNPSYMLKTTGDAFVFFIKLPEAHDMYADVVCKFRRPQSILSRDLVKGKWRKHKYYHSSKLLQTYNPQQPRR